MIEFNSKMMLQYAHLFNFSMKCLREVFTKFNPNTKLFSSNTTD